MQWCNGNANVQIYSLTELQPIHNLSMCFLIVRCFFFWFFFFSTFFIYTLCVHCAQTAATIDNRCKYRAEQQQVNILIAHALCAL